MRIFRTLILFSIWHEANLKQKVITAKHYWEYKCIHQINLAKPSKTLVFAGCGQLVFYQVLEKERDTHTNTYFIFYVFYVFTLGGFYIYIYMHTQVHRVVYIICWVVNLKGGVLLCSFKGTPSKTQEIQFYSRLIWSCITFHPLLQKLYHRLISYQYQSGWSIYLF